jgi:hypothetical protein
MALTPWYKVNDITLREDLREGKGLDTAEFAVNLDHVRRGDAPDDYIDARRFFQRTYLTQTLTEFAAQVCSRLSGLTAETPSVYNLATQFGGGKTHALTLLYHLAKQGKQAKPLPGVEKILKSANLDSIPEAAIATFVGTEFDSLQGRGGNDGSPFRKTPWGEIAFQLGGEAAFNVIAQHDADFTEPKGDAIRAMLPKDRPCLILIDEIINYVSTYRKQKYNDRLFNFIQALSETVRSLKNVVLVVSIPASEMEYTVEDEADEQRFKKMLDRLGKAVLMSAKDETSEIIRRRLFEWNPNAIGANGKILLPTAADKVCNQYADWVIEHHQQLPGWFSADNAREAFKATYPFHPALISVFERKWQALPRFQRTRGVLHLLAIWATDAYRKGWEGNQKDALISLGTAPLDNPNFRAAIFEQMGEQRLEAAITTDICGRKDSHAVRLDADAIAAIKKARLHSKVATTIFFESNGGCTRDSATLPEIRLNVAEPDLDIGNIETVLDAMVSECYYLTLEKNQYRFNHTPNLNKILADRRANVQASRISDRISQEVQSIFKSHPGVNLIFFPEKPSDIPNRPIISIAILPSEQSITDSNTLIKVESLIREAGSSDRTFKSAVICVFADSDALLRDEARKVLAWEDTLDEALEGVDQKQVRENLDKAKRDLAEVTLRTYRHIIILAQDNTLQKNDLGLITSSQSNSSTKIIIDRLRQNGDIVETVSPQFLLRHWPPAFQDGWSTKSIRDVFFAAPQFPRLLNADAIKDIIVKGLSDGSFAYVGKDGDKYVPFHFECEPPLSPNDIEISDDVYLIPSEIAKIYRQKITEPPKLAVLNVTPHPVALYPGQSQSFHVKGLDQYGQPLIVSKVIWSATGGSIDEHGVFLAGSSIGSFYVTAAEGEVIAQAGIDIVAEYGNSSETTVSYAGSSNQSISTTVKRQKDLSWQGEIPTQKWMNFYTKILSKFMSDKAVELSVNVTVTAKGDISDQKLEEMRIALQELGLDSKINLGE